MTVFRLRGSVGSRAGAQALSLLAGPLNAQVLQAVAEQPRSLSDLRRAAGSPPATTLRGHLRALTELGVLERNRQREFPGTVDFRLGGPGRDLSAVAAVLEDWLANAPAEPLRLGGDQAKNAVKALVDGWSSTMIRALAAGSLSLTQLNRLISGLNYPSLERRLGAMRLAGLVQAQPGKTRGTPYAITPWLRQAIAPLALAARWERKHVPIDTAPISRIDIESAFLLAVPLVSLPSSISGSCRFAVEIRNGSELGLAGVLIEVENGRVISCVSRLQGQADAWASGTVPAWIRAVSKRDPDKLEVGGDRELAGALVSGLQGALFATRERA